MNRFKNILYFIFLTVLVSSCCKEELEAPGDPTQDSQATEMANPTTQFLLEENTNPISEPAQINDDSDEEDEGRKLTVQ